jgi:hypothetical protein
MHNPQTHRHVLQNLDVYIREVRREQVLGPLAVGTIRFRKYHDSIFCDGLLSVPDLSKRSFSPMGKKIAHSNEVLDGHVLELSCRRIG